MMQCQCDVVYHDVCAYMLLIEACTLAMTRRKKHAPARSAAAASSLGDAAC